MTANSGSSGSAGNPSKCPDVSPPAGSSTGSQPKPTPPAGSNTSNQPRPEDFMGGSSEY